MRVDKYWALAGVGIISAAACSSLADPAFYRKDGGAIAEARAKLEALERELGAVYARWEELEAQAD
jgi:ATP-binding cassette subfamily F protein uup